jgi:hypothetical protein
MSNNTNLISQILNEKVNNPLHFLKEEAEGMNVLPEQLFVDQYNSKYKKWKAEINDEGEIDVDGAIFKGDLQPFIENGELAIKFGKVTEDFDCFGDQLTSLRGCPKEVSGNFYCDNNQLTSLEWAPEKVNKGFYCYNNKLTSLRGTPQKINEDFDCHGNHLTSLKDCPKEVDGDFYCYNNSREFTKEDVRTISEVKGRIVV